jgi:hypothetical protein
LPTDLCPWLGTDQDREIRHTEPHGAHLCYAQKRPAGLELEHQARFCLSDQHPSCPFYREPPPRPPSPAPIVSDELEDEGGALPPRFPLVRVLLWGAAILVAAVVAYYYGSALLAPLPASTPTGVAALTPSAAHTPSSTANPGRSTPTSTPRLVLTHPSPTFEFVDPTATPTPYPGGAIYSLSPAAGAAGWVSSDEAQGNHLGDSYLYSGVFDGLIYHGLFQLDLSVIPRGAPIHAATLEIAGLDDSRLDGPGVWEVRILARQADSEWSRQTFQDVHNAPIQWTLPPALSAADLAVGETNVFALPPEQMRDLEQRLLDEHYTVSFRIDGPLAGANSLFAWDTGHGPTTQGRGPRLLLNVGAPPDTPVPTGSPPPTSTPTPSLTPSPSLTPTPTATPVWVVVTSTPTPANAVTAAAIALRETARAETTGTATATPKFMATATPAYLVVTNTPTPQNRATAIYQRSLATAYAILTGTPTPFPLVTATSTPRPTQTPVLIWLDEITVTPAPTPTPLPTVPPMPSVLLGKIAFLSDRDGTPAVYVLDPGSGRLALLTARWPYDLALQGEPFSPDGASYAFVQNNANNVPQIYVHSGYYGSSWQLTFTTRTSYDPAWSPQGDQLAFVSTEGGNDEIYVIGIDGQGQRRLTFNQWEWDKHPSWSPDGAQIVFWSNAGTGRRQLWIMNADGSGRRLLLESPYNDWDPVWVKPRP